MWARMYPIYDNSKRDEEGYPSASYIATIFYVDQLDCITQPMKFNQLISRFQDSRLSPVESVCLCALPITWAGVNNAYYTTAN